MCKLQIGGDTMATKYSMKREALREILVSRCDHPTAEDIYFSMKELHPNVSLATVYRNLNLLVQEGDAIRLTSKDNSDRFDGYTSPHYHFHCDNCACISDVGIPVFTEIDTIASKGSDAKIKGHTIMFEGICQKCLEKNKI